MYLKIGTITKQVGLKGELRIYSTTDFSKERYKVGGIIYLKTNNDYQKLTVKTYRKLNRDFDVVSFNEYPDTNSTEKLLKHDLFAIKDNSILKENEYFFSDLLECKVYSMENKEIGKVVEIMEFPAQLTLKCLTLENKEFFLPFIEEFIKKIDINNKKITIEVIEGLL